MVTGVPVAAQACAGDRSAEVRADQQLQPAAEQLMEAVKQNPQLPTAHSQLGVVYLLTGPRDAAGKAEPDRKAGIPSDASTPI